MIEHIVETAKCTDVVCHIYKNIEAKFSTHSISVFNFLVLDEPCLIPGVLLSYMECRGPVVGDLGQVV